MSHGGEGLISSFNQLYSQYLPLVVFIWFIGVSFLLLRYLGLLIYVERLKNYVTGPVSDDVLQKIRNIAHSYKINRKIRPLISEKVTSPMIIGHVKPVLLIPSLAIKKLTEREMDVVLQHELAHVKRNDYMVNVFQQIIEILFFFHPATWWASSMVRKEREECCDVYAAQNQEEKLELARALTVIHEFNQKTTAMAIPLLNQHNLFQRISNLFSKSRMATFREGILVSAFFFLGIGFMSFVVSNKASDNNGEKTITTLNTELKDGRHLFARINDTGKIEDLFIEGKRIAPRKSRDYQYVVDSLLHAQSTMENKFQKSIVSENEPAVDEIEYADNHELPESKDNELSNEVSEEIKRDVINNLNENLGFNIDIDDDKSKVFMNADKTGFYMNVDDGKDKVKLEFGENGMFIKVEEGGKTVVHMDFGVKGLKFDINDKSKGGKGVK